MKTIGRVAKYTNDLWTVLGEVRDPRDRASAFEQGSREAINHLAKVYLDAGLETDRETWEANFDELFFLARKEPHAFLRLYRAMGTDWGPGLIEKFRYRERHEANLITVVSGGTGIGKSSSTIGLADELRPIEPARLLLHLIYKSREFRKKLPELEPGDMAVQDENTEDVGLGSTTSTTLRSNLEKQNRKARIHIAFIDPEFQEIPTQHVHLRALYWNPRSRFTRFLVLDGKTPRGFADRPWCRKELYEVYEPWKDANVARALRAQYNDPVDKIEQIMEWCENEAFVEYLSGSYWKRMGPKAITDAVQAILAPSLAVNEVMTVSAFFYGLMRMRSHATVFVRERFGVEPTGGFDILCGAAAEASVDASPFERRPRPPTVCPACGIAKPRPKVIGIDGRSFKVCVECHALRTKRALPAALPAAAPLTVPER